jgi:hypothetical protein
MQTNTQSRPVWPPTEGCYRRRLVRGGPWVACVILRKDGAWYVMENGSWLGPSPDPEGTGWPQFSEMMERVAYSQFITQEEAKFMEARRQWAAVYQPDHHAANARKVIDLDSFTPI